MGHLAVDVHQQSSSGMCFFQFPECIRQLFFCERISLEGPDRAESLSRGISEALITTVSGLGVGIPALIAFVLFSRKVETLLLRIEEEIMFLHDRLTPGQSAGKKASAKTKS